ncbi:MAG: hypothetical protein HY810_00115 [Candidatus Omnitrophica bacterium]|nr:hypothetical protein [Candidatus Omnitrophota bacterium]
MGKKTISICLLLLCIVSMDAGYLFAYTDNDNEWTGADKAVHFTVSCGLSLGAYNYYKKNTDYSDSKAKTAAFCTSLAFGLAKELIDEEFSWKDLTWDAVGSAVGIGISFEF